MLSYVLSIYSNQVIFLYWQKAYGGSVTHMCLQKVMQLFLCLNYRIEVKQRNFDDLMYDLQSLKEKNERLKDRVRDIWTTSIISYKYLKVQFFIFFINKEKKPVDQFIMLNLINLQSFVRIWQCKCMEIWDAKFANC